jgi:hypothetical protein
MTRPVDRRGIGSGAPAGFTAGERPAPDWRRASLAWRQTGSWWSPTWELTADGVRVATYHREGLLQQTAGIETGSGRRVVRGRGLRSRELFLEGRTEPAARSTSGWFRDGRITLADGSRFRVHTPIFRTTWTLSNEEDFPYLHVETGHVAFKTEGEVRFEDAGRRLEQAEVVVLLMWDLVVDARRRHAAGAGA